LKIKICVLAFAVATGCSGSAIEAKGVGFGPANSATLPNSSTRTETVVYGKAYTRQVAQFGRSPGQYQTTTGVPWLVFESASVRKGGPPLQGSRAMRSAMSYASSKWNNPYAIRMKVDDGDALLRVVTVDGISFAVMKSVRPKNLLKGMFSNEAYYRIMDQGIRASGCIRAGRTIAQNGRNSIQSLAAPVNC
jgi:hypothetical protein